MLKIKDNVDLKELEKYGFKEFGNCYIFSMAGNNYGFYIDFSLNKDDRTIRLEANTDEIGCCVADLDIIYDLIQDDLVDKVG